MRISFPLTFALAVSISTLAVTRGFYLKANRDRTAAAALNIRTEALNRQLAEIRDRASVNRRRPSRREPPDNKPDDDGPRPASLFYTRIVSRPEWLALYRQAFRAGLKLRFWEQYRILSLSDEQIERFEDLRTELAVKIVELRATADANGMRMSDPEISSLSAGAQRSFEAAATRATGLSTTQLAQIEQSEFPPAMKPFEASIRHVEDIAANLETDPLTLAQQAQLIGVVDRASQGGLVQPEEVDWKNVAAQSQWFLSPAQIHAIDLEGQSENLGLMLKQFAAVESAGG